MNSDAFGGKILAQIGLDLAHPHILLQYSTVSQENQ
jgi:hypothetical protein